MSWSSEDPDIIAERDREQEAREKAIAAAEKRAAEAILKQAGLSLDTIRKLQEGKI